MNTQYVMIRNVIQYYQLGGDWSGTVRYYKSILVISLIVRVIWGYSRMQALPCLLMWMVMVTLTRICRVPA